MIAAVRQDSRIDPLLIPDRDEPYLLQDVYEKVVHGCRGEIVLDFGDSFLRFTVDQDTDSIAGQFHQRALGAKRGYRSIASVAPWRKYLKKECGWTWLAINQQGYWDTVLISFDAVVPNILLNVMASSIFVCAIGAMDEISVGKAANPRKKKITP